MSPLFAFGETLFAPSHLIILLIVGILLFGKRLPEIGRSLGKGIVEFKKGIKGLEDDIDVNHQQAAPKDTPVEQVRPPQRVASSAPKFDDNPKGVTPPPKV